MCVLRNGCGLVRFNQTIPSHVSVEDGEIIYRLALFFCTVELGVLVPYPEEGREARDQRLPSAL